MLGHHGEIADGIKARHLQVAIKDALTFPPSEIASTAQAHLAAANYDHAPVMSGDRVVGIVRRDALASPDVRRVGDAREPIGPELLVSGDATVADLLGWLAENPFLFVLDGHEITGFVTPGDLNKQPARAYFFMLIAEIEIGLAEIVTRVLGPDRALAALSEPRQLQIRQRADRARRANVEPEWLSYLDLADLLFVAGASQETRAVLGLRDGASWNKLTHSFAGIRNAAFHGVRGLVDARRGPRALCRIDSDLHHALDIARSGLRSLGLRHLGLGAKPADAADVALAGVDGCRAGWVAAVQRPGESVRLVLVETTAMLLELDVVLVAVDMPIGLAEAGTEGRAADKAARVRLGARRSSVFSAPARQALVIDSWEHPDRPSFGLTLQAMGILKKVRDLDSAVTPDRQWKGVPNPRAAVAEVHPEVSFAELNGGEPIAYGKKSHIGRAERLDLLRPHFPGVDHLVANRAPGVAADDAIDALAALWSARRIVRGDAVRLGGDFDSHGLQMAIWC